MPEVMETEMGYIKLFKPAPKLLRDLVRGKVYHPAFFLPQAFNDKRRHFNGAIPAGVAQRLPAVQQAPDRSPGYQQAAFLCPYHLDSTKLAFSLLVV